MTEKRKIMLILVISDQEVYTIRSRITSFIFYVSY